jgi:hypothetical protein
MNKDWQEVFHVDGLKAKLFKKVILDRFAIYFDPDGRCTAIRRHAILSQKTNRRWCIETAPFQSCSGSQFIRFAEAAFA